MKNMRSTAVCPAARITRLLDAADVLVVSVRALRIRIPATEA